MTCSFSKEFSASSFTAVENLFIREYLPVSSGESVKVYLYGLFLCQNPNRDEGAEEIANALQLTVEQVIDCFTYWEEFGLVSVLSKDPLSVQYLPIRNSYGAKPKKIKTEKYTDFTKSLQLLLPNRMISTSEYTEYFTIMETYGIKPDAMLLIVRYCVDRKGGDISYRYISTVAKDFGNREITTIDKVEKELSSYILRTAEIEKILKAVKAKRQPDIDDQKLYKKWTQELNFETDNIVFAATKAKRTSMAKLDDFIMELYSMKCFSKEEIENYISNKQAVYDLAIKINRALSIYVEVLDTEVDTYIKKWLSYGYSEDCLCFIASYCFKQNDNSLSSMDALIESLRARGLVDLSAVSNHFSSLKEQDEFIAKMLSATGVSRRPTDWDRQNLAVWKGWNFTEEMILEAAKKSAGRTSPVAYMNAILSNWKNNDVFTVDKVDAESSVNAIDTQAEYNREYERRREVAIVRAQKNVDTAMAIDGFAKVYARLNSLEKDMAFAEVTNNQTALDNLEKEKASLTIKANEILSIKSLTLDDLSPRYRCVKCNDTGYIGTERCDCLTK